MKTVRRMLSLLLAVTFSLSAYGMAAAERAARRVETPADAETPADGQ